MSFKFEYARSKFSQASKTLNESDGDVRLVLEIAYTANIVPLKHEDIPEECIDDFEAIRSSVLLPEDVPPIGGHSGSSYAISGLSDQEIEETIALIHHLSNRLENLKNKSQ